MKTTIKCPFCEKRQRVLVPEDKCLVTHECKYCKKTIIPPVHNCCIICAYSKIKCPVSKSNKKEIKKITKLRKEREKEERKRSRLNKRQNFNSVLHQVYRK